MALAIEATGRLGRVTDERIEGLRSLLEGPSPAVLTTYRKDGSASTTPVWFHWNDGTFEVVIANGDVKLGHLARDPQCTLVVFEAVPPFRGIEVRGVAELLPGDVSEGSSRDRRSLPRTDRRPPVLREAGVHTGGPAPTPIGRRRVWDLAGILPT